MMKTQSGSKMPDYSAWLTPERLAETEIAWSKIDRTDICKAIMEHKPGNIIEFCCGTGWIPAGLPPGMGYVGLDSNLGCINNAKRKNPERAFEVIDIRDFDVGFVRDMALALSCLKHFVLVEWDEIYGKVLRAGRKTLTSIYLGPEDVDEPGYGFPHTMVTHERMERVVEANGHRIVKIFTLPPLCTAKEPLVLTEWTG